MALRERYAATRFTMRAARDMNDNDRQKRARHEGSATDGETEAVVLILPSSSSECLCSLFDFEEYSISAALIVECGHM